VADRPPDDGWRGLFASAFANSRNAMALVDEHRCHVDVNGAYLALLGYRRDQLVGHPVRDVVVGGPIASEAEWQRALRGGRFSGTADLVRADGGRVGVQWAAASETVTGRRLILFVALNTSRWGGSFRRDPGRQHRRTPLTDREREIVHLMALGSTGPEIAQELGIAHDTVRTHARNAMAKSGARSRAHLVAKALADGVALSPQRR
jgi:PAS domain S-box-containing protein